MVWKFLTMEFEMDWIEDPIWMDRLDDIPKLEHNVTWGDDCCRFHTFGTVIEQEITRGFYYELVTELPTLENGMIKVSNKAGLGMDLKNSLLNKTDIIIKQTT